MKYWRRLNTNTEHDSWHHLNNILSPKDRHHWNNILSPKDRTTSNYSIFPMFENYPIQKILFTSFWSENGIKKSHTGLSLKRAFRELMRQILHWNHGTANQNHWTIETGYWTMIGQLRGSLRRCTHSWNGPCATLAYFKPIGQLLIDMWGSWNFWGSQNCMLSTNS